MKLFLIYVWLCYANPLTNGFNIGVRSTSCSLDQSNFNDPCGSLYAAECDGRHCRCPANTREDKALHRCTKSVPKSSSGSDDLFDLPFEYDPNAKPKEEEKKPSTDRSRTSPSGDKRGGNFGTSNFNIGVRGTSCSLDRSNFNDPCASLYGAVCDGRHCTCPPNTQEDKNLNKCSKGAHRGGSGDDLFDLPYDYVPGGKQPATGGGHNPSIPTTDRKQPPVYPPPQAPRQPAPAGPGGDPDMAKKTGGGIGGGIALIIIVAIAYFCCCNKAKGKEMLSKLPFMKSDPGTTYAMQQQQPQEQQPFPKDPNTQPTGMAPYPQQYSQPLYQAQSQYPPQAQYPQPQYPPQAQYPPQPQYPQQQQYSTQATAPPSQ